MAGFEEFYYDSCTGKNKIRALKCVPEGEILAIVQIAHGIAEHIDRYRDFMSFLADHGILAVGNDHLGHGKTMTDRSEQGLFSEEDGWNKVVKDLVTLHDLIRNEYPNGKYFLFGHSMGSFLVRTYIADYPGKHDAVLISGTGHQGKLLVTVGNIIADNTVKTKGYDSDGAKLNQLSMGSYLKRIKDPRTSCDWLSRDEKLVDLYIADEKCGFTAKAGLYCDMLHGVKYVTSAATIAKVPTAKPVYFMSGEEDPVGDYGKGVQKAYDCFKAAGVKDVTLKLYPGGRHEMLNEINRDEVYQSILLWIQKHL